MNEDTQHPETPKPSPAQPPEPKYVGHSNVVDRSDLVAAAPVPTMAPKPIRQALDESTAAQFQDASNSLWEAGALVIGLASTISYPAIAYYSEGIWLAAMMSLGLAAIAAAICIVVYRRTRQMTPTLVIALSLASYVLVLLANILVARLMIDSARW